MIGFLIIICEIAFWIFVLLGLFCRYMWKKKKLSAAFLLATPIIDLLLIAFTIIDINKGSEITVFHGLAAVYIGVTIAFGHSMIKWMDAHFSFRFAGGEKPVKKYGRAHAIQEMVGWLRHLAAFAIGACLLYLMTLFIPKEDIKTLLPLIQVWTIVLGIDFLISFSYCLWPKKKPSSVTK
ncbi:hypothetical protein [Niallia taxi]|uniref:hypothetical protein n=1 Tax=Niallia taxi TaxID=2499688 RepID=UPI00203BC8DC|nr:hypothetical protein [Niallia taxi]MCM3215120.1 hypothetical protein [Niallia taxi]MDK8639421.1 hypothetical protein [Niallia taxi]MED4037548.1 hypothetical protein [Niallia taxi]